MDVLAPAAHTARPGDFVSEHSFGGGANGIHAASATDSGGTIIARTLSIVVSDFAPNAHDLLGGFCSYDNHAMVTRTVWIRFDRSSSDSVYAVAFDWKRASDPDAPQNWHGIGLAMYDDSSRRWAYAWNDTSITCGLITLRARATDNTVPVPDDTTIIFADSVRMDNCPPIVHITNVNGNPSPNNMNIGRGQTASIVTTVADSFGNGGNSAVDSVAFYYSRVSFSLNVPSDWVYIGSDVNGAPWQSVWDTGALVPGVFLLHAVAWDHARNCGEAEIYINLIDEIPQRAWIVGFDGPRWSAVPIDCGR